MRVRVVYVCCAYKCACGVRVRVRVVQVRVYVCKVCKLCECTSGWECEWWCERASGSAKVTLVFCSTSIWSRMGMIHSSNLQ